MTQRVIYRLPALCLVLLIVVHIPAYSQDKCLECHEAIGDKNAALFKRDVHFSKGISCANCHGGNALKEEMEEAMDLRAGFTGVPKGDHVSALCAKCHSDASVMLKKYKSLLPLDQMESLTSSVHGQLSTSGKERIAQCTSCHGAHGIVSKSNRLSSVHPLRVPATCSKCHANASYMRAYDPSLPIDQLEKYRTSVHGKRNVGGDAKAAECASCHGSHEILAAKDVRSHVYPTNLPTTCARCHSDATYMRGYGIASDQYEKFAKSVHGQALLEKKDLGAPACNDCHGNHGAVPPGVESISKVCGTCHALNAELFSASPHKKAYDKRKLPECETCHGNHEVLAVTDDLLGVNEGAVCVWCHGNDKLPRGYHVARTMRQLVDSLMSAEKEATSLVVEAEQKGMEVGESRFMLRQVHQARLETRTKVHSFNEEQFREVAQRGFDVSSKVSEEAGLAIEEYYYRRWGLLVASFIITILAASLYVYIRRIERNNAQ
ncbi:MAG: cytochrome c3 family protein [Ignavibacteriales bacterium]|nr:cytochrome c3 family protein [Ignavibacteriales bacterium]